MVRGTVLRRGPAALQRRCWDIHGGSDGRAGVTMGVRGWDGCVRREMAPAASCGPCWQHPCTLYYLCELRAELFPLETGRLAAHHGSNEHCACAVSCQPSEHDRPVLHRRARRGHPPRHPRAPTSLRGVKKLPTVGTMRLRRLRRGSCRWS
jgi:hypothetical protein